MQKNSSAASKIQRVRMINNPSYAKKPELFHAVALQQQRLALLGLGPPLPRRKKKPPPPQKRPTRPSAATPSAAGPSASTAVSAQCSECSDDDETKPPPTLTLAQRMGLESGPDPALTANEWAVIAERSKGQGRSKEPCAICLGDFTTDAQVLLSCAHVFHRACLNSWERHSKSRCCPVCRKLHYQKRTCHDGEDLYRHECVVQLQAAWRGQAARRTWGPALRRANPATRRAWSEHRLSSLTDKLVSELDAEHDALDDLFAEIDCSVASSRAVFALGAGSAVRPRPAPSWRCHSSRPQPPGARLSRLLAALCARDEPRMPSRAAFLAQVVPWIGQASRRR